MAGLHMPVSEKTQYIEEIVTSAKDPHMIEFPKSVYDLTPRMQELLKNNNRKEDSFLQHINKFLLNTELMSVDPYGDRAKLGRINDNLGIATKFGLYNGKYPLTDINEVTWNKKVSEHPQYKSRKRKDKICITRSVPNQVLRVLPPSVDDVIVPPCGDKTIVHVLIESNKNINVQTGQGSTGKRCLIIESTVDGTEFKFEVLT